MLGKRCCLAYDDGLPPPPGGRRGSGTRQKRPRGRQPQRSHGRGVWPSGVGRRFLLEMCIPVFSGGLGVSPFNQSIGRAITFFFWKAPEGSTCPTKTGVSKTVDKNITSAVGQGSKDSLGEVAWILGKRSLAGHLQSPSPRAPVSASPGREKKD